MSETKEARDSVTLHTSYDVPITLAEYREKPDEALDQVLFDRRRVLITRETQTTRISTIAVLLLADDYKEYVRLEARGRIDLKWTETKIGGKTQWAVHAKLHGDGSSDDDPYGTGMTPNEALGSLVTQNKKLFGIRE